MALTEPNSRMRVTCARQPLRSPEAGVMQVLERKSPEELNGRWYDFKGEEIPW